MAIKVTSEHAFQHATLVNFIVTIKGTYRIEKSVINPSNYVVTYRVYYYENEDEYKLDRPFLVEFHSQNESDPTNANVYVSVYDTVKSRFTSYVDMD